MARSELRISRLLFAVFVTISTVVGACQLLVKLDSKPSDGVDATVADAADAAPDVDPEPGVHPACRRVPPPAPPPSGAPSLKEDLVFATVRWDVRETDAGDLCPIVGYDFDNVDTAPPPCLENRSCAQRQGGLLAPSPCDVGRGADNAFARLLEAIEVVPGAGPLVKDFSPMRMLQTGAVNLLFDLHNYNGTADDNEVSITIYASAGYQYADSGVEIDAGADADAAAYIGQIYPLTEAGTSGALSFGQLAALPQVWDGGQSDFRWVVDERSVETSGVGSGVFVPRQTVVGYVSNWVLVADELGEGIFPLGLPGASGLPYREGNLTAYLDKQADGRFFLTHGRLSARFTSRGLLNALGAGRNPGQTAEEQLCHPANTGDYNTIYRPFFCKTLDLPTTGEPNDPTKPCQEFSATLVFSSVPGEFARYTLPQREPQIVSGRSFLGDGVPCRVGDAFWCDDCDWGAARECPPN